MLRKLAFLLLLFAALYGVPAQARQIPLPGAPACDPKKQSCVTPPAGPPSCQPGKTGATCNGGGPATQGAGSSINVGAGNPINVITGNKYQREVDMPALPGVLGLEIVRHYNSFFSSQAHSNGILGRGWKLSYETDLYANSQAIQILQADGNRVTFDRDARDPSLCTTANPENGSVRIVRTARGDEYTWTWENGRRLSFNTRGRLVQIAAPSGEFVSMQHDAAGMLLSVTDPQGRSLQLRYLDRKEQFAADRFRGVQSIESPVGRFTYAYGSAEFKGTRVDKGQLRANLVKAGLPGAVAERIYHYEDARHPTLLTGISIDSRSDAGKPLRQRIATYGYDADGRGVLTVKGEAARLERGAGGEPVQPARLAAGTGVEQVTLDSSVPGRTVISNSLGQKTVYRHALIGGNFRLLEVRGAGCATCGEANVRYTYDANGRVNSISQLSLDGEPIRGKSTEYDQHGRTVKVSRVDYVKGKPVASQWQLRYEYAGASQEPVLVASPSVVPGREVQTGIRYNDIGQPLAVTQTGWAPGIGSQQQPTPLVRTTAYRYVSVNGRSLLSEIDGPLANGKSNTPADSDITRFEWDAKGNAIVAMIAPGNHRSTVRYDQVGRIAAVSNAEGRTTVFDYDARNLLVGTTSGGMSERIQYDAHGNIVELGHGDGVQYQAQARFGTDAAGRNIWTASSLGILERNRYDTEGNLIEASTESASLKRSQRYVYDAVGRLSSIDEPGGGTRHIRWNAQNLPESLTDTLGRERSYRYDTMGNLAQVIEAANTVLARLQETSVRFEHDVQGRASAVVTPSGALTRYVRDDFGRTIGVTSADSGTSTRSYDAAGRLIGSTDATGNRAVYEYEVSGRIARQTVIDGGGHGSTPKEVTTTWTYEGNRLTAIDYPGQAERYRYDEKGLLADRAVILTLAGGAKVTSLTRYRHDAMGRLESISLPDGSTIEYKRNAQHQVVALERNRVHTSWLRWLLPAQSVMAGLERDIVGLKHATFGNGIQAFYQRSKEGALARIVYRQKDKAARGVQSAAIETLLGIAPAHAENTGNSSGAADTNNAPVTPSLPGALSFPQDSAALLDYRYLWDSQGNLLHTRGKLTASSYVYDAQDRLIVAGSRSMGSPGAPDYARYFLDGAGNRVLAQENLADQSDLSTNTAKIAYTPASNRWRGGPDTGQVDYDASGQPARIGSRRYDWDAFGRLTEVHQGNKLLGSYRYNHKGERIGKSVDGIDTYYMYEGRQLAAELDSRGHITRQYIYLADQPIALIGQREGILPAGEEHSWLGQLAADIATIFHAWLSDNDAIAYLHNDHLGTTQVVTDGTGRPLWQAHYSPYGKVVLAASTGGSGKVKGAFKLNLRLPGQYDDGETGLYYNDHRYYDPQRGRYLTPDPLGLSGGLNSYAYVAGNPLKYVDPSGLILFAFDGTNNSNPAPQKDQLSNVWKFANAYNDGNVWYMSGVGRPDPASGIGTNGTDEYNANTARARVDHMLTQLDNYMNTNSFLPGATINLDITGFSRGAAEARDFSNKVAQRIRDNAYKTCLAIRFMGLWDTVAQFGAGGYDNDKWQLSVPAEAKNVFQAVALNEYRLAFPGESILGGVAGQTRIERGFIGSHADIGGGYAEGDLSDIPLIWMHKMATDLNIVMRRLDERDATVSSPVIHDKAITGGAARAWRTRNATGTIVSDPNQRKAVIGGMSYSQTAAFISYYPVTVVPNPDGDLILVPGARRDAYGDANIVGDIKMADYSTWLKKNYGIDVKF